MLSFQFSRPSLHLAISLSAQAVLIFAQVYSVSAQTPQQVLIVGFQDKVLKYSVNRGGLQFRDALKTVMPSPRRREISAATAGRLKRNIVNSIARGQQSDFKYIAAKAVSSSRNPDIEKIRAAEQLGLLRYATPDIRLQISALPNDPNLSSLWGLQNTAGGFLSTKDVDINAPEAWEISRGSNSVVVAVLDTGIDPSHPDLAENVWVNKAEIPANGKDDDQNGYVDDVNGCNFTVFEQGKTSSCGAKPFNKHYHGTHVAGTIGARGDNRQGISGVAQQVSMVSLAFLDDQGSGSLTDMLEAIGYAIDLKKRAQQKLAGGADIKVINGSFGHNEGFTQPEFDAFKAMENAGILFVAAAGNGGPDGLGDNNDSKPTYPSSYDVDSLISVAAIGKTGSLTYFSNYGADSVDIAAPGSGIVSTVFEGKYASESGTSMAAPHVVGAAALLYAVKPNFSPWIAKQLILSSGKDSSTVGTLSALNGKVASTSMLDVAALLKLSQSDLSKPKILKDPKNQTVPKGSTLVLNVQAFSSSNLSYRWLKDGKEIDGARKASLTVRDTVSETAGSYYCIVSSGSLSAQSAPAQVAITDQLQSDINGDGKVNFADMLALFKDMGKTGPGLRSDLNQDQVVDFKDLDILLKTTKFK
jgi:serine protease